jgi:hypothetical protein
MNNTLFKEPVYKIVILNCENIDITNRTTEAPLDSMKEAGLQVNEEETGYFPICRHQIAGQNLTGLQMWLKSFKVLGNDFSKSELHSQGN